MHTTAPENISAPNNSEPDSAEQREMPIAILQGEPLTQVPRDLYIPPDALNVFLETFEGPLDLLLYLIKRQNIDILDIPIADITAQYMKYIELMEELRLELAGEYLLMAAMLAEIKSRMLLPRPEADDEQGDPRAELVKRIQEYERYKQAAEDLDALPRYERDVAGTMVEFPDKRTRAKPPEVALDSIVRVFAEVLKRADMYAHHHIHREPLSVRERMIDILDRIDAESFTEFKYLFKVKEGRAGVVVAFLAVLELVRNRLIELVQNETHGPLYIRTAA